MKFQILILAVTLISTAAQAELGRKAPLKADFHSMIVDSQQERKGLADGVSDTVATKPESRKRGEHGRVTDFVDVEIGWGEAPKMVDRRFDSVGEPRIAAPSEIESASSEE